MDVARIKVLTIMGTRPEAIKLAPVIRLLEQRSDEFESVTCVTAQHRELLDQVLDLFEIRPTHDLDIMSPGQSLAEITARAIEGLDGVIAHERPQMVLVQGDTTTVFCGALVAFYHKVVVGHVEAGLRTGHKYIPYPEEINRSLLAPLADLHFAPTERARLALLKEGVSKDKILVTGNTVIDALLWVRARVRQEPPALSSDLIADVKGHRTVLVTGHRRESFGCAFENICLAIRDTADTFEDVLIVYPVHLNPNVREPVGRILSGHDRIRLIEPQPYGSFVWLMDHAEAILTDSGGVQEEAPSLGKPVLVMRETTERVEGLEDGSARLVGVARESIAGELSRLLRTEAPGRATAPSSRNPYGDGTAARKIVEAIERHWKHQTQRGVASARPGG